MSRKTKTIDKETQEAIKKLLLSNDSILDSPQPSISFDADFSRILQKKREEQLEASRLKSFECDSSTLLDITNVQDTTEPKWKRAAMPETTTTTTISKITATPTKNKTPAAALIKVGSVEKIASAGLRQPIQKPIDLENSLLCTGLKPEPQPDGSDADDSFLEWERQCNMDEQKQQILNADETCLFDIEPPSELFNQTVNQTVNQTYLPAMAASPCDDNDDSDTFEMSPVKYIGVIRPSTIIEETSSQFDSTGGLPETSASSSQSMSASSLCDTAETSGILKTSIGSVSKPTPHASTSTSSSRSSNSGRQSSKDRSRRETFAFKRTNYTFFGANKNLASIDESVNNDEDDIKEQDEDDNKEQQEGDNKQQQKGDAKDDLIQFDEQCGASSSEEGERNQFNDTIEAIDFFLEEGRKMIEQTPVANRDAFQRSMMETPLFSCKRKRIMSEMANEMLPLPKRGPLIDFATPIAKRSPLIDFSTPAIEKNSRAHKRLLD